MKEDVDAADYSVARNITSKTENAKEDEIVSHDSLINVASEEFEENVYLTLTVDDSINIQELISYAEVIDYGTFFVTIDKLNEVKEILKDYTVTNENEETLLKDKFIIKQ